MTLARRLRALREERWPDHRVTQLQLARALGNVSVPLISSWESSTNPRIPPGPRLDAYALLFASSRSFQSGVFESPNPADLTAEERQAADGIREELRRLRNDALRARASNPREVRSAEGTIRPSPWYFPDGSPVTIVCAELPQEMLDQIPYTNPDDPDYTRLCRFSDLDALVELFGHLRASNPATQVRPKLPRELSPEDHHSHFVVLGGVDWNAITRTSFARLHLPVRQVAEWDVTDGQYFEVDENGTATRYRPEVEVSGSQKTLLEDVGLFARAASPFDRRRTITMCNGMYARGTHGVVRALTDESIRDRNAEWLQAAFGNVTSYCVLTRIQMLHGSTLTPDWELGEDVLFTWSR